MQSLGARYDDVRPGIVLSRLRSIEGVVSGFDTEEGRAALFPDAIAMFIDLHLSGQDFLATFPNVRRIEREVTAAGLEKDPEFIDKALEETEAIYTAAAGSEIVAPGAVNALGENEIDIREAQSVEIKADLVADRLLIYRNFVSQALRAIARKSGEAWEVVGPDFVAGSKAAARMLPPLTVIALITTIAGPIAGLAGLLRGDLFKSVRGAVTTVRRSVSTPRTTGQRSGNADWHPEDEKEPAPARQPAAEPTRAPLRIAAKGRCCFRYLADAKKSVWTNGDKSYFQQIRISPCVVANTNVWRWRCQWQLRLESSRTSPD